MAAERRKCLKILELHEGASEDEIRKAYKRLALKYHPDKNDSDDAKGKFQEIGYAYKYLTEGPNSFGGDDPFHMREDILVRIFEEMFFGRFHTFGGFPFFFEEESDEDDYDNYYESDSDSEYYYTPRFFVPPTPGYQDHSRRHYENRYPGPNRTGQPFKPPTGKQLRKKEKKMRQKQRQKEKKQEARRETQHRQPARHSYSDDINMGPKTEKQKKPEPQAAAKKTAAATAEPVHADKAKDVKTDTSSQSQQTKKQKKKEMSDQHKREKEMEEIAAELKQKLDREKEKQQEKEKQEAQKKETEESDLNIQHFFDSGKKSRKARQREKKRQETESQAGFARSSNVSSNKKAESSNYLHQYKQGNRNSNLAGRPGSSSSGGCSLGGSHSTGSRFDVLDDFDFDRTPRSSSQNSTSSQDSGSDFSSYSSNKFKPGATNVDLGNRSSQPYPGASRYNYTAELKSQSVGRDHLVSSRQPVSGVSSGIPATGQSGQPMSNQFSGGFASKTDTSSDIKKNHQHFETFNASKSKQYYPNKAKLNSAQNTAGAGTKKTGVDNLNIPDSMIGSTKMGRKPDVEFGGSYIGSLGNENGGIKTSENVTASKNTFSSVQRNGNGIRQSGASAENKSDNQHVGVRDASDLESDEDQEYEKDWSEDSADEHVGEQIQFDFRTSTNKRQERQPHSSYDTNRPCQDGFRWSSFANGDAGNRPPEPRGREFIPRTRGFSSAPGQRFGRPPGFPVGMRGPAPPVFAGRGMHRPPRSFPPPPARGGFSRPPLWNDYSGEVPVYNRDKNIPPITRFSRGGYRGPQMTQNKGREGFKHTSGYSAPKSTSSGNPSSADKSTAYKSSSTAASKAGDSVRNPVIGKHSDIPETNLTYSVDEYFSPGTQFHNTVETRSKLNSLNRTDEGCGVPSSGIMEDIFEKTRANRNACGDSMDSFDMKQAKKAGLESTDDPFIDPCIIYASSSSPIRTFHDENGSDGSLDSLDDFDINKSGSSPRNKHKTHDATRGLYVDMGLEPFLSHDNLGVPEGMFGDHIKNYYK